ncbi:MAG TPA: 6,7-dimethyl-8-ribityllumazine synthase [Terriglobia bacterium]|nr:6,7-dimethyl-8-ribityllumazine synthase [Terriglobia bacterium]
MRRKSPKVNPPEKFSRRRVAIIRAEYNSEITSRLEQKCLEGLRQGGIPAAQVDCFRVPGCLEIPLVAQRLATLKRYDAMIALGAVIRGDTHHFDLVANECARGIMDVSLRFDVPIIFEVLATYNRRDALRRAGNNLANKGYEAALAAVEILRTLGEIES